MTEKKELTKEQLIEYVKKQRVKIKQLEGQLAANDSSNTTKLGKEERAAFENQLEEKNLELFRSKQKSKTTIDAMNEELSSLRSQLEGSVHSSVEKQPPASNLSDLNERLRGKDVKLGLLESTVSDKEQELCTLQKSMKEDTKKWQILERELKKELGLSTKEILRLKHCLSEAEARTEKGLKDLESAQSTNREIKSLHSLERDKGNENLSRVKEEREKLRKKMLELEGTIEIMAREKSDFIPIDDEQEKRETKLEADINKNMASLAVTEAKILELETKISEKDTSLKEKERIIIDLNEKLSLNDDHNNTNKALQDLNSQLQNDLTQSKSEIDSLKNDILSSTAKYESLKEDESNKRTKLKLDLDAALARCTEVESDISKAVKLREELEKRNEALSGELSTLNESSQQKTSAMQQSMNTLAQSQKNEIDKIKEKNTNLVAIKSSLEKDIASMNVEISEKDAIIESKNLENVDALGASSKEKQSLVAEICSLKEAIENKAHEIVAIKDDGEKKFNTAMERVKRMKVLLTKSQSVKAEKEAELKRLSAIDESRQIDKFSIIARILLPSSETPKLEDESWCLILYESNNNATECNECRRWILESKIKHWLESGSSLLDGTGWPQAINDKLTNKWEKKRVELHSRIEPLEAELKYTKDELDSIVDQFRAYKAKAQSTLKRAGEEGRSLREKESNEIDQLMVKIEDLEEQLVRAEKRTEEEKVKCVEEFQGKMSLLQCEITDAEAKCNEEANRTANLQVSMKKLEETTIAKEKEWNETVSSLNAKINSLVAEVESKHIYEAKLTLSGSGDRLDTNTTELDPPVSDMSTGGTDADISHQTNDAVTTPSLFQPMRIENKSVKPEDVENVTPEVAIAATSRVGQNQNKLLLNQKYEMEAQNTIAQLRLENGNIIAELSELQRTYSLFNDQVDHLKIHIRDLEESLSREKELNASNRRVNADYLSNVVKKFLVTNDSSEKAKLVPVICSILHFQRKDTLEIKKKWPLKSNGGLLGWIIPTNETSVLSEDEFNEANLKLDDSSFDQIPDCT
jgi:chromosome segregation ATPase